jgi:prepilin-type N-terminal cleavage/methylation domain-containing protein
MTNTRLTNSGAQRAFTLIELLVVIAIIAIGEFAAAGAGDGEGAIQGYFLR